MENPFVFGKVITGDLFLDRENDRKRLGGNIRSGINSMLISPRRWGKSSLVRQVAEEIQETDKSLRFCFIDMFNIRSEEDFYAEFALSVLKAGSDGWEKWMEDAKILLKGLIPRFNIGSDPMNDFTLTFDWQEVKMNPTEILNLPEAISQKKNFRIVVCLDEFQNLGFFSQPLEFQKTLRAHWQLHNQAVYVLLGSRRHMLIDIFNNPSMPFYRFGDLIMLDKIPSELWPAFIRENFITTGKQISLNLAAKISGLLDNHPYYIQNLAYEVWQITDTICYQETIDTAVSNLLYHNQYLFQLQTESLTNTQVAFLRAMCNGVTSFTSVTTLKTYALGSVSNIRRIRDALIQKEIIDIIQGKAEFLDPLFKLWFVRQFIRNS